MRAGEFSNTKLVIFDIDDTLVNTDTRVNVVRDGQIVKQLNSHDFTHYKLQPGEEFDFGAFRDAREFFTKARPIPGMIRRLKQDIATGNRVIMLTARSDFNDRDVFLDTFRQYGIDMDRVHVYRAGNLAVKAATEEKKKIILQHLLGKQHYDKVIMYDDSVPNLNAFLSLQQDYPWSRFYAWHVDPNGQAAEYHTTNMRVTEARQGYLQYIQSWFPDWPDYVIRDWLYPGAKGLEPSEMEAYFLDVADEYPVYRWELRTLNLRLDSFDADTQRKILAREGGSSNPMNVPRDADRHATQAQKIQQTGAPSQEPIIVMQRPGVKGLELVEGWHRTIQNIKAFPNGYRGRAWIGYTE